MANSKITIGSWTWDTQLLLSKMITHGPDDCWGWRGAMSPGGPLFGARKNNKPQMTQARRLIYMTIHGVDAEPLEIRHTCGNKNCTNPQHMTARPNHMHYYKDGRPLTDIELDPPEVTIDSRQLVPLDLAAPTTNTVKTPRAKTKTKTKTLAWWQQL